MFWSMVGIAVAVICGVLILADTIKEMNFTKCGVCKHRMSTNAVACPGCGDPNA